MTFLGIVGERSPSDVKCPHTSTSIRRKLGESIIVDSQQVKPKFSDFG